MCHATIQYKRAQRQRDLSEVAQAKGGDLRIVLM
jgi:hypothetical protein